MWPAPPMPATEVPAVIVDKMVAQAVEKAKSIEGGRAVGRASMRLTAIALGTIAGMVALLLVVGPEFLRQGASALLVLSKSAEAASPYAINVLPGDVEVPKGSDQTVAASLAGFRSNDVGVWVKGENEQCSRACRSWPPETPTSSKGCCSTSRSR